MTLEQPFAKARKETAMRWTRLLALFILLLVPLTSHAQTQTHRPPRSTTGNNAVKSNEADIRQWVDRWAKAFRTHDVHAILALYAPGVVAYDLVPPLQYVGSRTCWLRINTAGSPDRFSKGSKGLIEKTL